MGTNYYDRRGLYTDEELVSSYAKHGSQIKAAKELGVSRETVARAVRRAGIPLDGRKNNGGSGCGTPQKISDDELISACQTMTIAEIAAKYGMHTQSLPRRFKRLGVFPVGHGTRKTPPHPRPEPSPASRMGILRSWHYIKSRDAVVRERHPAFVYVESRGKRDRLKCKECGAVIERATSTVRDKSIVCEYCREIKEKAEARRKRREEYFELLKDKACPVCGKIFHSKDSHKIYCCNECRRKKKGSSRSMRSRAKKYGAQYEPGITLGKLVLRDSGICQICGKPINWNDNTWGSTGPTYPSIDHIVALKNGGGHTWDNVQLAHIICNSYKRDM